MSASTASADHNGWLILAAGLLAASGGVMVHAAAAKAAQKTNTRCNIWKLAGHATFSVARFSYTKLISLKGSDAARLPGLHRLGRRQFPVRMRPKSGAAD